MESLVYLRKGFNILQSDDFFKLTQDSVLLADFVRLKRGERGLDLGAGVGCLGILVLLRQEGRMDGIELVPGAARLAAENYARCGFEQRGRVEQGDFTALPGGYGGQYDVCVSNPPYFNSGPVSKKAALAVARNSTAGDMVHVCQAAAKALKSGGRFYLCIKPARLAHLLESMAQNRLAAKRLRLVHHRAEEDSILALVEGRKDGACQLQVLPPLLLTQGDCPTAEYRRIHGDMA